MSIRTKQISGSIAHDGCDTLEASSNTVAVIDNPDTLTFQQLFQQAIKSGPDMAAKISNIGVLVGTLSHGHLNCTMRNMSGGNPGCECVSTVVEEGTQKECKYQKSTDLG